MKLAAILPALALMLAPVPSPAQEAAIPLLPEAEEIDLALSAGPPDVAAGASVWVLGARGFRRVREGNNGWSCLVQRDHPRSLAPLCYDPAGTDAVLPAELELGRLRQEEGLAYDEAKARVLEQIRSGALPSPRRPVLSLMLSPDQRLYTAPDGEPVGPWLPHVMIHFPGLTNEGMGLTPGGALGWVQDDGLPTAYLVVPVARWSDGTAAEAGGAAG